MWLMLQQEQPDDYVVATGETHTVLRISRVAFGHLDPPDWQRYVNPDPRYFRPTRVDLLIGDRQRDDNSGWETDRRFPSIGGDDGRSGCRGRATEAAGDCTI